MNSASLTFHGVLGSYPVAGHEFQKYGGNTACLEYNLPGITLVLDAGTGIINLGEKLADTDTSRDIHVFISHYHLDHIQGLPFFKPLYQTGRRIIIHMPRSSHGDGESLVMALLSPPYSPIGRDSIKAEVEFRDLEAGSEIQPADGIRIEPVPSTTHPREGVWVFRINNDRHSLVYASDVEFPNGIDAPLRNICRRADILVHDAQYLDEEYFDASHPRKDFGHSTVSMAAKNAASLDVGRLFLFHYDPGHTDGILEVSLDRARRVFPRSFLAREKLCIEID